MLRFYIFTFYTSSYIIILSSFLAKSIGPLPLQLFFDMSGAQHKAHCAFLLALHFYLFRFWHIYLSPVHEVSIPFQFIILIFLLKTYLVVMPLLLANNVDMNLALPKFCLLN
jgi:hypothetical protein